MSHSRFTYDYYRKIICALRDNNYCFSFYDNDDRIKRQCILRHDVDFDVSKAVELALFEDSLNVKSTYFFLLTSDFYNVFSLKTINRINTILSLGHKVGLHFDERQYDYHNSKSDFKKIVENELVIFENAIGKKITVVSMHRPSKFVLNGDLSFDNAINYYSKEFFMNFKYISDSRMNWKEDVLSIIQSKKYNKIHLFTHPFWYSINKESTREKFVRFIDDARLSRLESLSRNFKKLDEFVNKDDFLNS